MIDTRVSIVQLSSDIRFFVSDEVRFKAVEETVAMQQNKLYSTGEFYKSNNYMIYY